MACETCLPFLSNNSLAKLLPPLKFWSLEVRKETCAKEGQTTAAVLSWGKGSVCREARAEHAIMDGGLCWEGVPAAQPRPYTRGCSKAWLQMVQGHGEQTCSS